MIFNKEVKLFHTQGMLLHCLPPSLPPSLSLSMGENNKDNISITTSQSMVQNQFCLLYIADQFFYNITAKMNCYEQSTPKNGEACQSSLKVSKCSLEVSLLLY